MTMAMSSPMLASSVHQIVKSVASMNGIVSHHAANLGWGAFHLGVANNTDPEPGQCRRTDEKKWRCARDVVPDQRLAKPNNCFTSCLWFPNGQRFVSGGGDKCIYMWDLEGDFQTALQKAKEAGKKERLLSRTREQAGLADQVNMELAFAVCFNLNFEV